LRLDDNVCPHCGRELESEWYEFPPALQKKYDKPGEWYVHPCTPECERKNERKEWELARRDARIKTLQKRSGLSERLKRCSLANFRPMVSRSATQALMKAEEYLEDWEENRKSGRGLYICGDVGTGKTHLAVAVMNELIKRKRVPALFVTAPELLDNLRPQSYNNPELGLDEWMNSVKNADLLVLDDLGSEKATAWVQERVFIIIDHRYREMLPTIITSNIGPRDLGDKLGPRTASRIVSICEGIELDGPDYRETSARGVRRGER
jgi:DNA replication protein DnaC